MEVKVPLPKPLEETKNGKVVIDKGKALNIVDKYIGERRNYNKRVKFKIRHKNSDDEAAEDKLFKDSLERK